MSLWKDGLIYEFYDEENIYGLVRINSTTLGANEPEAITKLLGEYRTIGDDQYDFDDWIGFLEGKGYNIEVLKSDYPMFF